MWAKGGQNMENRLKSLERQTLAMSPSASFLIGLSANAEEVQWF